MIKMEMVIMIYMVLILLLVQMIIIYGECFFRMEPRFLTIIQSTNFMEKVQKVDCKN